MPTGSGDDRPPPPTYSSGERVFAPPLRVFDVEWVAREVQRTAATSFALANIATTAAWNAARTAGGLDAAAMESAAVDVGVPPEIADAAVRCVVAYCDAYEVDPADR